MKKNAILFFMILIITSCALADDRGGIFAGADILTNVNYDQTSAGKYALDPVGVHLGFYIPVKLPLLDYHYKVKTSFHEISQRAWEWGELHGYPKTYLYDRHFSILNELLIGKELMLMKQFGILPQGGIGVLIDALFDTDGTGVQSVANHCLFLDYNCSFRFHLQKTGLSVNTGFLHSIRRSWDGYTATNRFSVSVGIFK